MLENGSGMPVIVSTLRFVTPGLSCLPLTLMAPIFEDVLVPHLARLGCIDALQIHDHTNFLLHHIFRKAGQRDARH